MSEQETNNEPLVQSQEEQIAEIDALLSNDLPEKEPDAEPGRDPIDAEADQGDEGEIQPDEPVQAEPEVDYDQLIPMPDGGEPVTIGALKDRLVKLERSESDTIERENELMRRADDLSQAIQAAGGEIPQGLRDHMETQQKAHLQREHAAMMEAIPEWKDQAVFDQDRKAIAQVGADYGFSPQEVSNIMDHRVIKFMRDYSRLKAKEVKAKDNVKQLRQEAPPKGQRRKPAGSALDKQLSNAQTIDQKIAAIDALMKSG